jgi:hypothetical protein
MFPNALVTNKEIGDQNNEIISLNLRCQMVSTNAFSYNIFLTEASPPSVLLKALIL